MYSMEVYRDGGTIMFTDGETKYYLDGRIGSQTRNTIFDRYPGDAGARVVTDKVDLERVFTGLAKSGPGLNLGHLNALEKAIGSMPKKKLVLVIDFSDSNITVPDILRRDPALYRHLDVVTVNNAHQGYYALYNRPDIEYVLVITDWFFKEQMGSIPTDLSWDAIYSVEQLLTILRTTFVKRNTIVLDLKSPEPADLDVGLYIHGTENAPTILRNWFYGELKLDLT